MNSFRRRALSLCTLGLITGSATTLQGCDEVTEGAEALCGPCGSIETGQLSISGDTQLDGLFTAVADLGKASGSVRSNFEAELLALAEIYAITDTEVDAEFVSTLVAAIRADFSANVEGDVRLQFVPPQCSVSANLALEAQASCEAQAGCDVEVDPGEASVTCEGQCQGSCSGSCSGEISCTPPGGSLECDVGCEGTCELRTAASCEGTCRGTCSANGSTQEGFEGQCDGMCEGTCELDATADCNGTCHGTCHATFTPPECDGLEIKCNATCEGSCSGGCAGEFTPPSASANCEASADCNAQATAQAEANLECSPPSLEFGFEFRSDVDADVQADFLAKLDLVRVRLAAALAAAAQSKALFTGEVDGEIVFENGSPFVKLQNQVTALVSVDALADIDIPAGRLPCVAPAFSEAATTLVGVGTDLQFTAEASTELFAFASDPNG